MPAWMRRTGLALGIVVLVSFAYAPLVPAGLLGPDYRALLEATGAAPLTDAAAAAPLARLSLAWSCAMFGIGDGAASFLRLENLLLLACAAVGLALATRRLLLPWVGSDHAGAAAWCGALVLVLHPLALPAVADTRARADLLGLVFCVFALASFLRGRQDRRIEFTALALVLCLAGAFTVDVALGLPLLLAGAELIAAHRYRPLRVRLRTAATTFVVFGAAALIDIWLSVSRFGREGLPVSLRELASGADGVANAATSTVEKLGLLALPSNPFVTEFFGLALAGGVFLVAVHPGLSAARSAPRLWGWVMFSWLIALLGTEVFHLHVRVNHTAMDSVRVLLPSVAVVSVGLGIGATALSGLRRFLFPCTIAVGYAALAHANALPFEPAARSVGALRADIAQARELHGDDTRLFVVGLPPAVRGLAPVGDATAWLAHPGLDADGVDEPVPPPEVHGMLVPAFLALAREPELAELRREPLLLLFENAAVDAAAGSGRTSLFLPPERPSGRPLAWRSSVRSPDLDVEALAMGALIVRVPTTARVGPEESASWRASERTVPGGTRRGLWLELGEERVGVFDLGASLAWRLGDRVKRIWFEGGLRSVDEAQLESELPALDAVGDPKPRPRRTDWVFLRPGGELLRAAGERGHFVVTLLALGDYRYTELVGWPTEADGGRIRFGGAASWVADAIARTGAPVAWTLDYRIDDLTLARARGRRVALSPEPVERE